MFTSHIMHFIYPRIGIVGAVALLVTACATGPEAPPAFDAGVSLESQLDTFFQADRATSKRMKSVQTLALTGCNVLFATQTSASASTGGGLFSEAGNTRRAEAKVSQIYTLEGLSDTDMQTLADDICADAEQRLARAGYVVKPHAEVRGSAHHAALVASGKAAPFDHSIGSGGAKQSYRLFTRSGEAVHGAAYLGTAGGLAQAFKSAGGNASWNHETRLMQELGVDAVHLDVLVDFAAMESSGNASATQLASTNSASVSGSARLAITGQMSITPLADLKCWERFGKQECGPLHDAAKVTSKLPVSNNEAFYDSLVDTTTTGDRVAAGFTKALSVVAALGGVGGVSSTDITRYTVTVSPATYGDVTNRATRQFLDMAVLMAKREGGQ